MKKNQLSFPHGLSYFLFLFLAIFLSCEKRTKQTSPYVFHEEDFVAYSGIIVPSAKEYLALEQTKMVRSFSTPNDLKFQKLPQAVDLSEAFPQVGDQGKQNSCVGWVISFGIKSFQENRELGWGLNESHLFSPSFIYNQLNKGKDEGVDLMDALKFIVDHGTVPSFLMPYQENDFVSQPNEALKKLAKGFRALGYRRIDEKNLQHIKAYLASGEPIILVVEVYSNFLKKGMQRTFGFYHEKLGDLLAYHVVVAVGYDDEKKAIKIINSWGREWGIEGYGWIDYDFFSQIIKQGFIIYDTPTPPVFAKTVDQTIVDEAFQLAYDNRVLIVPDEAGLIYQGKWLRLFDTMIEAEKFLQERGIDSGEIRIQPDILGTKTVAKIEFYPVSKKPAFTNQGVTFNMSLDEVHRIYRQPDLVDSKTGEETYFYHAVTQDWGGLPTTRHLALNFHYSPDGKVTYMMLELIFKEIKIKGNALVDFENQEKKETKQGTEITSPDGRIFFIFPPIFSDIKKTAWEEAGYSYFSTNLANPQEFLVVRIYNKIPDNPDPLLLEKRIRAELAAQGGLIERSKENHAGIEWEVASSGRANKRYFTLINKFIYEVQILGDKPLDQLIWVDFFWSSFKIKK